MSLLQSARAVRENAYAPYSNYPVSSIVVLDNGEIFVGTNQENAAFPSGMCAERVAVFAAQSAWPTTPISSIYIMTGETEREPAAPCGACRQVLHESEYRQKEPYNLYLLNRGDVLLRFKGVQDLLPFSFSLPTSFSLSSLARFLGQPVLSRLRSE